MHGRGRRVIGMVVCCIAAGAALVAPAAARADDNSITYAGEVDTAGPLVMDTSNADDPQTHDLYAVSSPIVLFIQRMPVTKTITAVTLGDLGQGSTSCSGSPTILVRIREITSKVLPNGTEIAASQSQPLPATPSRITWPLNTPLTLKQGHAYAFTIGVTGCTYVRQTTWRHNSSLLEPAPREIGVPACQVAQSGSNDVRPVNRQWHDYGNSDFFGTGRCVNYGTPTADMPSGWLAVGQGAGNYYILTTAVPHGHPAPTYCDEGALAGWGLIPVFWKTDQYGSDDYVCQWSVFADWLSPGTPGATQRYGWWYAMPFWPSRDALPTHAGAMYVKLDTIDYTALLNQYTPLLKYDNREQYFAQAADGITHPHDLIGTCVAGPGEDNELKSVDGVTLATAEPACFPNQPALSLDWLRQSNPGANIKYPDGVTLVKNGDYFSEGGNSSDRYVADSDYIMNHGMADAVYGRAVQDSSGTLWLQYWIWYYYNDAQLGPADLHEGDWENIQLRVPPNTDGTFTVPDQATYGEHEFASRCLWSQTEQSYGHPVVYPGLGPMPPGSRRPSQITRMISSVRRGRYASCF